MLGCVRAVELKDVLAALTFDGVAAVAGIPDERVVAGAHQGGVGPAPAVDHVIPGTADQRVVAVASDQRVIAGAAVDGHVAELGPGGDPDLVVAAAGLHVDRTERAAIEREVDRAVLADVELDDVGIVGRGQQLELVARGVADDLERPALHLSLVRGRSRISREAQHRGQADAADGARQERPRSAPINMNPHRAPLDLVSGSGRS